MKIIDNALTAPELAAIQNLFLGGHGFPWYYNDSILADGTDDILDFQFVHGFYADHRPSNDYFYCLAPVTNMLDAAAFLRVKANLNLGSPAPHREHWHVDYNDFSGKTALFYVNTNDGATLFKDGSRVECVENRLVIFDGSMEHTGVPPTSSKYKIVINFNFYEA